MPVRHTTIDSYTASLPDTARGIVEQIRSTIRVAMPDADESIRYQMPTFGLNGRSVVHIAAWRHHIGMYPIPPIPPGDEALEHRVAPYRTAKGIGRFPLAQPMPYDLIEQLVILLAEQHRREHQPNTSTTTNRRTEQP